MILLVIAKKSEQLRDHDYIKMLRLTNANDLEELSDKDKAAGGGVWQSLAEK